MLNNTYLLYESKILDILKNGKLDFYYYLCNNINNYNINDNILNTNDIHNFKNQFDKHIQINQKIIFSFNNYKNSIILDFYNSLTSQKYYKNIHNIYLTNYNLNFKNNSPQYINNNGCFFIYENVTDGLNNNFVNINLNRKLDDNEIKYFNINKKLISNEMIKKHYNHYVNLVTLKEIIENNNLEKLIKLK